MAVQSILGSVTTGRTVQGQRIVIAGPEKIGKTTLACGAPGALLVPLEQGYAAVSVPKTPMLDTWEGVLQLCEELRAQALRRIIGPGFSVVWDSGTAIERLIHDYILRKDGNWKPGNPAGLTMNSALGGYGKAYAVANEEFARWTRYADELTRFGINTIVTCHVFAAMLIDPSHGEYNSWDLLLHSPKNQKEYGKREFITQWADMIGFLHEPIFVMKAEDGKGPNRAVSSNQGRMLAVERTPSWVAGNRYGLTGLIAIPKPPENTELTGGVLGGAWNYLAQAIYQARGIDVFNRAKG